jgi:hypothetical protein
MLDIKDASGSLHRGCLKQITTSQSYLATKRRTIASLVSKLTHTFASTTHTRSSISKPTSFLLITSQRVVKMLAKSILSLTCAATCALAWPAVVKRQECTDDGGDDGGDGTVGTDGFTPVYTYNYDVGTGAIECSPAWNRITKSDTDNGHHITTLVTFEYPAASAGSLCQFGFRLTATDTLTGDQGGYFDLFRSQEPAPGCTSGWPPGNLRGDHLARLRPVLGGDATYTDIYIDYLTEPTPCAAPGTVEAYELVGVFDNVHIEWQPSVSGPYIAY